ncbi:hypothetical protein Taro_008201 [Colocasia esculenta]|uniref:DNA-directed RNA polymerase n=1 Tax=Colocasia esculenta TaxID=4460 RepID=A0A843TWG5_COLES|nr:hypothetical protein [Colocasia esculenta]
MAYVIGGIFVERKVPSTQWLDIKDGELREFAMAGQRLIHMAEDKVKFRNTGLVHPLTWQPVADMKRFGGVRFGEMERDYLVAHGAAANLYECLFTLSDSSQMHILRLCSKDATWNVETVMESSMFGYL